MMAPPKLLFIFHQNIFYILGELEQSDGPLFVFYSDQTAGEGNTINPVFGRYSHQVPIICLSAIKIPANVLSSDQVVQPWQILGWTWTEHSHSSLFFLSFINISLSWGGAGAKESQVWDGVCLSNISSLALQLSTATIISDKTTYFYIEI